MLVALLAWLLAMGAVTAVVYALDKAAARRRGARRVPERTLFALNLVGGVGGAWLAFFGLRHKTRHRSFWIVQTAATIVWAGVLLVALVRPG